MSTIQAATKTPDDRMLLPPGPKPLPIVGNLLDFRRDQLGYIRALERRYGKMATLRFGNFTLVMLFRPEHVRYVLTEHPRNFTNSEFAKEVQEIVGNGLLSIDGEAHRQQRRLVQPAFHKKRIEGYANVMTQHTNEMLEHWHSGDHLDMHQEMQALTLRIVAKCLFNVDMASEVADIGHAFTDMLENGVTLLEGLLGLKIDLPITAYGRRMAAKHKVDAFVYKLIEQRRAEGGDTGDVLSMLLEAEEADGVLDNTQVHDHILTFVAAGHETTANALTWTCYLLSQYPQVREKLQTELQTVLAGRTPTPDDMAKLPYTEWVINESLRMYPPAWAQGRRSIEPFDLDGYHFPAGTNLMFSQWVIHYLPDVWGDPETFRPERWDPEHDQKIPAWSYFPFGGGPRICIGMPFAQLEAKLLLATIIQRFTPELAPDAKVVLAPRITLRPKYGMRMILHEK